MGVVECALNSYKIAYEIQRMELGNLHISLAETLHNVGVAHQNYEDLDAVLESYKEDLDIY